MTTQPQAMRLARQAGFFYCLLIPLGIFGLLVVPDMLYVSGDAMQTFKNIQLNEGLLRTNIALALAIQVTQLFAAIALYRLFRPIQRNVAFSIVLFTMASVPMAMINELSHFAILAFTQDTSFAEFFSVEQRAEWVNFLVNLNANGIVITQIFWGFWLLPMGYLILKSGYAPALLGWALYLAGTAYIIDTFITILMPSVSIRLQDIIGWGEAIFPLWLLIKGVKTERWDAMQKAIA